MISKEEYEKAKKEESRFLNFVKNSEERMDILIERLCRERENLRMYEKTMQKNSEIIKKYELQENMEGVVP